MRGTYLSENSLGTTYGQPIMQDAHVAAAHSLDMTYRRIKQTADSSLVPNTTLIQLSRQIMEDMLSLGLQVEKQTFSHKNETGVNVIGVIRGPRATGTESIVLAASFSSLSLKKKRDPSGLSLLTICICNVVGFLFDSLLRI